MTVFELSYQERAWLALGRHYSLEPTVSAATWNLGLIVE
jgi:hypothetical protein